MIKKMKPCRAAGADMRRRIDMAGYSSVFNITDFGAVPDGKANAAPAFQAAVAACRKMGGGEIYVPAGCFLTGPVELHSNMTLYLDAGATLRFSDAPGDYPVVQSRWEGVARQVYMSCVYAEDAENIAVEGRGTLDGCGERWWRAHRAGELAYPRPKLVSFHGCRRVRIADIRMVRSPSWTVNPVLCEDVTVDGVTIQNPADSPNTDGIDPDSCVNVHISNCHIDVGDDCIAVKSGTEGTPQRMPTRNVAIANCTMVHGHGGVVLGSEMSGGISHVVISNCVFEGTDRGIRLKSRRGRGGVIEDVRVSNIVMDGVLCPFIANLYYFCGPGGKDKVVWDKHAYPVDDTTPAFRHLHFSGITARNVRAAAGFFYGLAEMPVEDVTFSDVSVRMQPDAEPGMPDMMANLQPMKQRGFFCANVKGFSFHRVMVSGHEGPAFHVEHGEAVEFDDCRARNAGAPAPLTETVGDPV